MTARLNGEPSTSLAIYSAATNRWTEQTGERP
jgi:hypothetical protein